VQTEDAVKGSDSFRERQTRTAWLRPNLGATSWSCLSASIKRTMELNAAPEVGSITLGGPVDTGQRTVESHAVYSRSRVDDECDLTSAVCRQLTPSLSTMDTLAPFTETTRCGQSVVTSENEITRGLQDCIVSIDHSLGWKKLSFFGKKVFKVFTARC